MKVGIFSKNMNFMKNVIEEMENRDMELLFYALDDKGNSFMTGNETIDLIRFSKIFDEADVVFAEFVEDLAHQLSIWKWITGSDKPLVFRLHRIELYEPFLQKVIWPVVDDLIFVAPQCKRKFQSIVRSVQLPRMHVIPNGYDSELFVPPKYRSYGKRMLMAGNIYWKKGHYSMIEFMSTVPDWKLSIVGEPGRQDGMEYYINCLDLITTRKLGDRVSFYNKVTREDLVRVFHNHDIIISASLEEGTHCVVAEGMLTGMYPLVRHWYGADEMYPKDCIWDNFEELKEKLEWWSALSIDDKEKASEYVRDWVIKRYDYRNQARLLVDVIEGAAR